MRLYLAPISSLNLIHHLRIENGEGGLQGIAVRKKYLDDAINTKRALDGLDETACRWLGHAGDPIRVYVDDRTRGTSTKHLVTQVLGGPVLSGTFLDIGHGICVCTPQFLFSQMAKELDPIDAISLGMELCGTYSIDHVSSTCEGDAEGLELDRRQKSRACTYDLPRAMASSRAVRFTERLWGRRGKREAQTALRWVADGSASPMETAVYLLLCLPKRLGGYGRPKPVFNPKLVISNPDGVKERYPDLFWPGVNIDVEYNSDAEHAGEWARYRDSKREVELVIANVKVLPLTRAQLMDVDEFDAFAQGLRRMLGVRTRPTDSEWIRRRAELRKKLLAMWLQE